MKRSARRGRPWTLETDGFLAGGGLAGFTPAWSLQGPFLEGALQLRGTPFR